MKKSYQSNLILLFLITILTLYIVNSNIIISAILKYTELFITKLFPTSFLLFTFSSLLINFQLIEKITNITKKNSTTLYVIIMSMISGFPSGPKYTKELYKKNYITKNTANYLLYFTHFPNPLFILGPVSTLINSQSQAAKILLSIIISNFIIAIFFYKKAPSNPLPKNNELPFSKALNTSITSSIKTLTLIYGTSIFFYLIATIITNYINFSPILYTIINSIFDLTIGIFSTSIIISHKLKTFLILIFLTFGSLSIHIQIKSILSDTLEYKHFLFGRILSTLITIIAFIIIN